MNRLKQYFVDEAPRMPEGDYWVIETRTEYWVVSADTAGAISRREYRRAFDRERRREEKEDRRPWEDYD